VGKGFQRSRKNRLSDHDCAHDSQKQAGYDRKGEIEVEEMDYPPTSSIAGAEVLNFVKNLKEEFLYQFACRSPYNRFSVLPGECYGKLLIDTPLAADTSSPLTFAPGYIGNNPGGSDIMAITEADLIIFQSLLTFGFEKPSGRLPEDQYADAEYFAMQKAYDLDHGMGEIRMRLARQYPFLRSFAVRDRVQHSIEEHKDDKGMFVVDLIATLMASIMIRKTPDGRHLPYDVTIVKREDLR
jgi:hypothetical protein